MIEIQCPNCQRTLKVPDKYVGTEGACNYCGGRIEVQIKPQPPAAAAPIPAEGSGLLQAQLAEARGEIVRLSEATESERLAREKAETERNSALARVAELEAAVAQAAERERDLASRAELDRAQTELAEMRQRAESVGRELDSQREKAQRAEARLREVRGRLAAVVEGLSDAGDQPAGATGEATATAETSACPDFTPADAAAILVGAGPGTKSARWGWLVGLAITLLAVAAGLGVWGLSR